MWTSLISRLRWRGGLGAVTAMIAACGAGAFAVGLMAGSRDISAGSPPGWTSYADRGDGLTVEFPSSWHRARRPLTETGAVRDSLTEILALGSGPLPVGAGGECHFYPTKAMRAMGLRDVLIVLNEERVAPRTRWLRAQRLRWVHPMPSRFTIHYRPRVRGKWQQAQRYGEMNRPGELRSAGLSPRAAWTELEFRSQGRLFRAVVAIGTQASARAHREVLRTLDSLRFRRR